jgi:hypothetical protein
MSLRDLLATFDAAVPAEHRDTENLSEAEQGQLLKILVAALEKQNAALNTISAPTADIDLRILDPEQWPILLRSAAAVSRAESLLRSYFARPLEGRAAQIAHSMFDALLALMSLSVSVPVAGASPDLKRAARNLIAELVVAREAATGVNPRALQGIRATLREAELPDNLQKAYQQARLYEKILPASSRGDGAFRRHNGQQQQKRSQPPPPRK